MVFRFRLTQTSAARKSFRILPALKTKLKNAGKIVAESEISLLQSFELSVVAMSDAELLELNRSALGHDWLTDVITFELERTEKNLEAEIYVSVERAKENAKKYSESLELEFIHLIIHGVLHLTGYDDKSKLGKKRMRTREGYYLARFRP